MKRITTHVKKRNVQFLRTVASREISPHVDVVVLNNPGDDVGRRHSLSSLRCDKHSFFFQWGVNVIYIIAHVRNVIVGNEINLEYNKYNVLF